MGVFRKYLLSRCFGAFTAAKPRSDRDSESTNANQCQSTKREPASRLPGEPEVGAQSPSADPWHKHSEERSLSGGKKVFAQAGGGTGFSAWPDVLNGPDPVVLLEFEGEQSGPQQARKFGKLLLDVNLRGLLSHKGATEPLTSTYANYDSVRLSARYANSALRSLLRCPSPAAYEALLVELLSSDTLLSEALKDICVAMLEAGTAEAAACVSQSHPLVVQHPLPDGAGWALLLLTLHPLLLRRPAAGPRGAAAAGSPRQLAAAVALRYRLGGGVPVLQEQVARCLTALSGMPASVTLLSGDGRVVMYQNTESVRYMGLRQGAALALAGPQPLSGTTGAGVGVGAGRHNPSGRRLAGGEFGLASPAPQATASITSFLIDGCDDDDVDAGGGHHGASRGGGFMSSHASFGGRRDGDRSTAPAPVLPSTGTGARTGARADPDGEEDGGGEGGLLQELFALSPLQLGEVLSELQAGRAWKGIVQVPHLLAKPPPPALSDAAPARKQELCCCGDDMVLEFDEGCSWEVLSLPPRAAPRGGSFTAPHTRCGAAPLPPPLAPASLSPSQRARLANSHRGPNCGSASLRRSSSPLASSALAAVPEGQPGVPPVPLARGWGSTSDAPGRGGATPPSGSNTGCGVPVAAQCGGSAGGGGGGGRRSAADAGAAASSVTLGPVQTGTHSNAHRGGSIATAASCASHGGNNSSQTLMTLFVGGGYVPVSDTEATSPVGWLPAPPQAAFGFAGSLPARRGSTEVSGDASIGAAAGRWRQQHNPPSLLPPSQQPQPPPDHHQRPHPGALGLGLLHDGGAAQAMSSFRSGISAAAAATTAYVADDDRCGPRCRAMSPYASAPARRGPLSDAFLAELPEDAAMMMCHGTGAAGPACVSFTAAAAFGAAGGGGGSAGLQGLVTRGLSQSMRQSIELRRTVLGVGRPSRSPAENPLSTSTWGLVAEGSMRGGAGGAGALRRNTSFGAAVLRAGAQHFASGAELGRSGGAAAAAAGGGFPGTPRSGTRSSTSNGMAVGVSRGGAATAASLGGGYRPSDVLHELVTATDRPGSGRGDRGDRSGRGTGTGVSPAATGAGANGLPSAGSGGGDSRALTIPIASPRGFLPPAAAALGTPPSGSVRHMELLGSRMPSKVVSGLAPSTLPSGAGPEDIELLSSETTGTGMAPAAATAAAVLAAAASGGGGTASGSPPPQRARVLTAPAAPAPASRPLPVPVPAPSRAAAAAAVTAVSLPMKISSPVRGFGTVDDVGFVDMEVCDGREMAAVRTQSSTLGRFCTVAAEEAEPEAGLGGEHLAGAASCGGDGDAADGLKRSSTQRLAQRLRAGLSAAPPSAGAGAGAEAGQGGQEEGDGSRYSAEPLPQVAQGGGDRDEAEGAEGRPRREASAASDDEVCWHEVTLTPLPQGTGRGAVHGTGPMLLLMQTDVTTRVRAERAIAEVLQAEHTLLESIFPRHVLDLAASAARQGTEAGGGGGAARYRLAQLPLGQGSASVATYHPMVTILFADIKGFTTLCHSIPPTRVMEFLNNLYSRLDTLLDVYGVYKVETIGDCYMVAGGLMVRDADGLMTVRGPDSVDELHAAKVMAFAKAMLREAAQVRLPTSGRPVEFRIGLHSGPVMSGIVGSKMPRFCLFGDTVNTASRMESTCVPGCIHVSAATAACLQDEEWEPTGGVQVKGIGTMSTFRWHDRGDHPAAAALIGGGGRPAGKHSGPGNRVRRASALTLLTASPNAGRRRAGGGVDRSNSRRMLVSGPGLGGAAAATSAAAAAAGRIMGGGGDGEGPEPASGTLQSANAGGAAGGGDGGGGDGGYGAAGSSPGVAPGSGVGRQRSGLGGSRRFFQLKRSSTLMDMPSGGDGGGGGDGGADSDSQHELQSLRREVLRMSSVRGGDKAAPASPAHPRPQE